VWVAAALALLPACGRSGAAPGAPRKVTIGIQVSPAMALVMVAKDGGFFGREGLNVELKEFTAGKFALQAFLAGAVDFAVSGEVPVALATLQGNSLRVVTQVVERTRNEVRVVALRDRAGGDSTDAAAYFRRKKRKLATSFGGGPEFFTYTYLRHYQIRPDQVEIISQKPEDMPAALATGSVDAVAIFEPFAYFAERRSRRAVVAFPDPQVYSELYVLAASPKQLDAKAVELAAIVRALVAAGDFTDHNVAAAQEIVQRYTKLDGETVRAIWPSFVFRPALTPDLVRVWEAEAEWARQTGKAQPKAPTPDFRALIAPRFLSDVRPTAVDLH
jgi:NitT/TauT family transport system substrate-binding protein